MKRNSVLTLSFVIVLSEPTLAFCDEQIRGETSVQPTTEVSQKHNDEPISNQPSTSNALVSGTEQNMTRKPGMISVGVGLKRKAIFFVPVLHLNAKRPELREADK